MKHGCGRVLIFTVSGSKMPKCVKICRSIDFLGMDILEFRVINWPALDPFHSKVQTENGNDELVI